MRRILSSFLLLSVLLAFSGLHAQTVDMQKKEWDLGLTAAYWLSGDISVSQYDVEKEGSFLLRAFADSYITPKFSMGGFFNFSPYDQGGASITAYEFGAAFKGRFFFSPDFAIKPGLNIGYRWSSGDTEMDGLGVNLSIEFQKAMQKIIIFGEFGFLSQPAGGDANFDIQWAPIIYFGGGVTL